MQRIKKILKWDWGKQTYKGFGQSDDEFRGQSAPIWINTSPIAFLIMALWGFTLFIIVLALFISIIDNYKQGCQQNSFKDLIIFEIVIVGLNAIFDFRSYTKRYDTDQGWSRSLIYLTFQCILLGVGILLEILFAIDNGYQNCTTQNDDTKELFLYSIIITGNIAILLIIKLSVLIAFSFRYYYEPNAFLAVAKQQQA